MPWRALLQLNIRQAGGGGVEDWSSATTVLTKSTDSRRQENAPTIQ